MKKVKNLFVGKTTDGKYSLLERKKSGIIRDHIIGKNYTIDSEHFRPISSKRNTIPIAWYTEEENIELADAQKIYRKVIKEL